tara:strand:+ start:662 stop:766 length:105 start_codon:yes stop_codon:yes gene_type:complete
MIAIKNNTTAAKLATNLKKSIKVFNTLSPKAYKN